MLITLTEKEYLFASKIGKTRQKESEKRKLSDKYGFKGKGEDIHIIGAAGELAAAKALNLPWKPGINTFKKISDLAKDIEIRTRTKSDYDLIVRRDDSNNRKYILVYQQDKLNYEVVGWISGMDAKQEKWLKRYGGRTPAFFIPKEELKDLKLINFQQENKLPSDLAMASFNLLKNAFSNIGFEVTDNLERIAKDKDLCLIVRQSKMDRYLVFSFDSLTGEVTFSEEK